MVVYLACIYREFINSLFLQHIMRTTLQANRQQERDPVFILFFVVIWMFQLIFLPLILPCFTLRVVFWNDFDAVGNSTNNFIDYFKILLEALTGHLQRIMRLWGIAVCHIFNSKILNCYFKYNFEVWILYNMN